MKKLLIIIFAGLLVSNNSFAKEIKITHKDENSISITRSIWSESEMFEIAGKHCAQYKKYAFTFGVFNKKGVPDDKGKATRLYHCSKKYLSKSPLTGDDNIHWSNHQSKTKVVAQQEKEKKPIKVAKKEKNTGSTLLECKYKKGNDTFFGDAQTPDTYEWYYYLISSDFKTLYLKGRKEKAKGDCALGNCEKIEKWDEYPVLPLREETTELLYYGREWFDKRKLFDNHTIYKTNLKLVTYDNMMLIEKGVLGNTKDEVVEAQNFYQCKKINKFPF
jgi:hypothetical protein